MEVVCEALAARVEKWKLAFSQAEAWELTRPSRTALRETVEKAEGDLFPRCAPLLCVEWLASIGFLRLQGCSAAVLSVCGCDVHICALILVDTRMTNSR